jgi:hypothetical protein
MIVIMRRAYQLERMSSRLHPEVGGAGSLRERTFKMIGNRGEAAQPTQGSAQIRGLTTQLCTRDRPSFATLCWAERTS